MSFRNTLLYFFLLTSNIVFAQKVSLIGRIVDEQTSKSLEYVIISVFNDNDSLIGGSISKANGDFLIENLPKAPLVIQAQSLGYQTLKFPIKLISNQSIVDVGNLKLKINTQLLKEFEIKAEKAQVILGIDKRIYNVDKDLGAIGGSALDAMKNIPGLTVNSDNSVQLRNQSPTILVDGQPSALTLDQIPSNEVDRIEVITNPSVKYLASSTGGILNVILKKDLKPGYFGQLTSSWGTNYRRYLGGNISQREKGFSIQASGNYSNAQNNNDGFSNRTYLSNTIPTGELNLSNQNSTIRSGINGRLVSDIQVNIRTSLRLSYSYNENELNGKDNQEYSNLNADNITTSSGGQNNTTSNAWKVHQGSVNLRKTYPKEGKELNSDVTFISSRNKNNSTFIQTPINSSSVLSAQNNLGFRQADYIVWQLDVTNPIDSTSKLEYGSRLAFKQSYSDFIVENYDTASFNYVQTNNLSNKYRIDDFVGAAYINYSKQIGKFGYQAGIRYEQTSFVAEELNTKESFSFIYPKNIRELNKVIFPALYLSYDLNANSVIQLNFSRKIGRPEFTQLIPFITYADRQSIQIGNPVLGPEFITIEELNYSYSTDKISLLTGLYSRQSVGTITPIIYPLSSDSTILVSSFGNGKKRFDLGWENSAKKQITKAISINLNAHVFYTRISLLNENKSFLNDGVSYNLKSMLRIQFTKKLNSQISGSYEAPRFIAQGKINSIYYCDLSMSYRINKSFDFTATLSDVFNSKKFGTTFESIDLIQETVRRWETRFFRVNLTWKFGEAGQSIFRRKSKGIREPGNNGTLMQEL